MGNWVKGKDGKFAGSTGEGKSRIPTPSPITPRNAQTGDGDAYDHLKRVQQAYKQAAAEPQPTATTSHTVTHQTGAAAVVTHTEWSDGFHTVDVEWVEGGERRHDTLAATDDRPNVAGLIERWRTSHT